ncbi:MAG: hypothetical protein PUC82_02475 [bacterium]|nr:hypothetical protein [bacterium]
MKKIFILILIILGGIIFKIPEYKELNQLAIIESIGLYYDENNYVIYLREIIPIKSDEGINYEYKYYEAKAESIKKSFDEVVKNSKKKFYLKRCQNFITNLNSSDEALKILNIEPKNIFHSTSDIDKLLKEL